jgi:hypothetical protein
MNAAHENDSDGRAPSAGGWRRSWIAAVIAVGATYFYFLIFAEFAFLELAHAVAPRESQLRWVMASLGAGGVSGAAMTAGWFRRHRGRALLTWLLRACAVSAAAVLAVKTFVGILVAGAVVGFALGGLTVALAASLRAATSGMNLGLAVGVGTGLAYGMCNLPWLFRAPAADQALLAATVVGLASFAPRAMQTNDPPMPRSTHDSRGNLVRWVIVLLALVWMDSAAFYVVQHTENLRAASWGGDAALLANACIHLVVAVIAGISLDRGWRVPVTAAAISSLAIACLMLNGAVRAFLPANWFYTAGVSLYSVVLVEFPARDGRPWIAASIFAVAGWLGSAFGIGMGENLARIPTEFVAVAVAVVAIALFARKHSGVIACAVIGLAVAGTSPDLGADEIGRGREVYIAEGCIHCHSQYVRSRAVEEREWWGPSIPLHEAIKAAPPLFGTRRQGPDLANVGNRRSPEWNRLHLMTPQLISPGSRMPSYQYLFAPGDSRGDDLVAYLASLGAEHIEQRQNQAMAWSPNVQKVIEPVAARQLFLRLCVQCHGESGRGDGPLASILSSRPPDWSREPWRHVPVGAPVETTLSRIIKFGLIGRPMAGHEYLPDAEIVGLARYVETLHKASGGSSAVQP